MREPLKTQITKHKPQINHNEQNFNAQNNTKSVFVSDYEIGNYLSFGICILGF